MRIAKSASHRLNRYGKAGPFRVFAKVFVVDVLDSHHSCVLPADTDRDIEEEVELSTDIVSIDMSPNFVLTKPVAPSPLKFIQSQQHRDSGTTEQIQSKIVFTKLSLGKNQAKSHLTVRVHPPNPFHLG